MDMVDVSGGMEDDRIEPDLGRQATQWLVQLDDEPNNDALRLAFMDWLATSPSHITAWEETAHASSLMTALGPQTRGFSPMATARKAWSRRIPPVRAGALLALAACFAWIIAPDLSIALRSDATAPIGAVRIVKLEDGSTAHLAPTTAIAFADSATGRRLTLLRGEAWFDVAHDKKRPFRVEAGDSTVTVLGTAFSVRKTDDGTDVAVQRGRVAVTRPGGERVVRVELVAGQSLSMDPDRATRGTIRPDRVASWREGVAIVNDQPIGDVIERIRPWYKGYVIVRGPGLKTRHVSGIYDLRDPDRALEALARAHRVTVSRLSPWLRVVTVG